MATTSGPAKLVKAGFVQLDPRNTKPKIVVFQYNPETLLRRLEGVVSAASAFAVQLPGTAAGGVSAGAGAARGVIAGGGFSAGAAAAGASGAGAVGGAAAGAGAAGGAAAGGGTTGGASTGAAAGGASVLVAAPRETVSFTVSLDAADKLEQGDPLTQQNGLLPVISALELLLYPSPGVLTVWVSGSRRVLPIRISELVIHEQAFDRALNPIRAEVSVSLQVLKDADLANDPRGRALWTAHFATLQQLAKTFFDSGSIAALGLSGI
jgi:hypothetical protein